MIYGYIRCSTDKQDTDNQRWGINDYAARNCIEIESFYEEHVSGTKEISKRKLGNELQNILKKGDTIIVTELSRLSRRLFALFEFLKYCLDNEIKIYTIKEGYRLGTDIQSKVMAFAFGMAAEIERDMISMRTKEALAKKKAEGVVLGRPKGKRSPLTKKLNGMHKEVEAAMKLYGSILQAAKHLGVHRLTLADFLRENNLHKGHGSKDMHAVHDSLNKEHFESVIDMFLLGKPRYEIASLHGVHRHTIKRFIKQREQSIFERWCEKQGVMRIVKEDRLDILHSKLVLKHTNATIFKKYNHFAAKEIDAVLNWGDILEKF